MSTETLAIPEEHLAEFVRFLREALRSVVVGPIVQQQLAIWCDEMEEHLRDLEEEYQQELREMMEEV
jgi:hypothetical protein